MLAGTAAAPASTGATLARTAAVPAAVETDDSGADDCLLALISGDAGAQREACRSRDEPPDQGKDAAATRTGRGDDDDLLDLIRDPKR
jgi:hypothetical protein